MGFRPNVVWWLRILVVSDVIIADLFLSAILHRPRWELAMWLTGLKIKEAFEKTLALDIQSIIFTRPEKVGC